MEHSRVDAEARMVAIVLDPEFSRRLSSLAARIPVWIVDSKDNRPAVESLWQARRSQHASYDVTVFRAIPDLSPEDHLAGVLGSVAAHGDAEPEIAPFDAIEVYGIEMNESIEAMLNTRGFTASGKLDDGFRARIRTTG